MNLIPVDTLNTPALSIYKTLRDNAFTIDNSFIADSPKVVNILLETGIEIEIKSILATQSYYDTYATLIEQKEIPYLYVAEKSLLQDIVGHKIHHNVMMHGIRPSQKPLEILGDQIIMLDQITSTENIGSIARSAAALGINSYLLPHQGPHPYGRRSLRVSMGHISKLQYHLYENIFSTLKTLQQRGYKIYAAEVTDDATVLKEIKPSEKWVLLMGHEGKGISEEVLNACDEIVKIEMRPDIKSFNVAIAAAILMYQFVNS
ncbi:MAG: RNA methyltransferase [Epsilonproteobacteria bacterium]|nr:RNA methyltransferase [Campylobacterota bacterium]